MTHRPKPALLILGVLMLASCGGTGTGSTGATTSTTTTPTTTTPTTTTPTTVASTKTATIRITQDQTDCCYTEGQISFLRLSNNQGVQLDRGYAPLAMNAVLAQLAVEPGTYTLESWQRPCVASCPDLDQQGQPVDDSALDPGRADECSIDVTATEGGTSNVLISWAPGAGCETSLPEKQPPSDVPDEVALREPYPTCGTDRGLEDLALMQSSEPLPNSKRRCFLEAQMNGQRAAEREPRAAPSFDLPLHRRRARRLLSGDAELGQMAQLFVHRT